MNKNLKSKLASKAAIVAVIAQRTDLSASQIAIKSFEKIKGVYCKSINPYLPKGVSALLYREFRITFKACHKAWKESRTLLTA